MTESLPVSCETARTEPDYQKTAAMLLNACRMFFREPENEQTYLDWKNGRKIKKTADAATSAI